MIEDWDDAYANGAHISGADGYPLRWANLARQFRQQMLAQERAQLDIAYDTGQRQRLDFFRPEGKARGLMLFVHGGYWRAFDKSSWSHLAAGAVQRGWAVALPSYELAPRIRISGITRSIGTAISHAAKLADGPIRLCGHSAGGHLVTRMICRNGPLGPAMTQRIDRVVSISGLHDLRPLTKTKMNLDFRLDEAEAAAESPALLQPIERVELICWVGADERPEFIRQAELLANVWTGCGIATSCHQALGQHHFDVIDGLARDDSNLTRALLD